MIHAFVPIRSGSKGIPNKNVKRFCGKPLVYWVLKALHKSVGYVDDIFVAVDSDEYSDVVNSFGFDNVYIYRREAENATDNASTESVMLEFLRNNYRAFRDEDIFCLVQATSPYLSTTDIKGALDYYWRNTLDSLLTAVRQKRFLWNDDGEPLNYDYRNRPLRQWFTGHLVENGAMYISRVGSILNSECRLSGNIGVWEMPEWTYYEIDDLDDWIILEYLFQKHRKCNNGEDDFDRLRWGFD